jgi:hypothetical protein
LRGSQIKRKQTCGDLVQFWEKKGRDGTLNANTASAICVACKRVLSVLPHWRSHDVTKIDLEAITDRFASNWKDKLAPATIDSYRGRFEYALNYYRAFLKDPLHWHPEITPRSASHSAVDVSGGNAVSSHRFPLRSDLDVALSLPRDLSFAEAARLSAFITALAIDAPPVIRGGAVSWPPGYFEQTYGSFRDAPLERGEQGEFETREELE